MPSERSSELSRTTSGQLGLTLFNPLGHLESPPQTAHWDYPRITRATEVVYASVTVFLVVFGTFVADAVGVKADAVAASEQACGPHTLGYWSRIHPLFVYFDTKGKLSPPLHRGQLAGVGWVARGPPPVTMKWFIEERDNRSSCKPHWRPML